VETRLSWNTRKEYYLSKRTKFRNISHWDLSFTWLSSLNIPNFGFHGSQLGNSANLGISGTFTRKFCSIFQRFESLVTFVESVDTVSIRSFNLSSLLAIDLQRLPARPVWIRKQWRKKNENKNIQWPRIFNLLYMIECFRWMYIKCILANS